MSIKDKFENIKNKLRGDLNNVELLWNTIIDRERKKELLEKLLNFKQ